MAKQLETWISEDVGPFKDKPLSWLSAQHFFRDPVRPSYSNPDYFFSPADGVILYQEEVGPSDSIVDIKGKPYSLREALRDPSYDKPSLIIGIFMTFFDVHVNRVPYPGRLTYRQLEPIDTLNHPMLEVEQHILEDLRVAPSRAEYLRHNQRMVNRIETAASADPYYVLQIADYDVDSITPFELKQNQPCLQGQRFSQIRYGSQVDLIVPLSADRELVPTQSVHCHVEAGVDTLIAIQQRQPTADSAD
ncbi:MAG: phosphatidylserine decarboxylase [Thermoleophilaceae bacterium]|nr:phosphatidylserine decarboxylase [Thermoleophilaceae bacterium]